MATELTRPKSSWIVFGVGFAWESVRNSIREHRWTEVHRAFCPFFGNGQNWITKSLHQRPGSGVTVLGPVRLLVEDTLSKPSKHVRLCVEQIRHNIGVSLLQFQRYQIFSRGSFFIGVPCTLHSINIRRCVSMNSWIWNCRCLSRRHIRCDWEGRSKVTSAVHHTLRGVLTAYTPSSVDRRTAPSWSSGTLRYGHHTQHL